MNIKRSLILLVFVLAVIIALEFKSNVYAFDDRAHETLSERATQVSNLGNFLTTQLGLEFPDGINETVFNGRRVIQAIQDGAFDEDRPILWRPRHHFHNPRLAWDQAGWRPPPLSIQLGDSSVKWSQNENQTVGGKHSWKDARNSYFEALTATSDSDRKRLYGETFKSLGHLIHLVQDAAVPSHTRNDTHLSYKGIGDPDAFHGWAELQEALDMIGTSNPPPFNTSLLNQSSANANAPIPIGRIIDSTDGDIGTLALTPGITMGISEYSSANFVSDGSVNSPNFLSPLPSQVEVRPPEPDATGTKLRRYVYFRSGFGQQDYSLALASALAPYVIDPLATPTENALDRKVFQGYGTKLFPRAISYSAGLIDYFIRGNIQTYDGAMFQSTPASSPPNTVTMYNVANDTPDEETGNGGTLTLVLKLKTKFNTSEEIAANTISSQMTANVSRSPVNTTFAFSSLPFPTTMGTECFPQGSFICGSYGHFEAIMIYRGPLGEEADAVVVSRCAVTLMRERYTSGTFTSVYGGEACSG